MRRGRGGGRAPARRFRADRRAVTAVEYGLIVALVAVALLVGAGSVGTNLNRDFQLGGLFLAAH